MRKVLFPLMAGAALVVASPGPVAAAETDSAEIDRLLGAVEQATRALAGFRADVFKETTSTKTRTDSAKLKFLRPNYFEFVLTESGAPRSTRSLSDGQSIYGMNHDTYSRVGRLEADGSGYHWYHNEVLEFLATASVARLLAEAPVAPVRRLLPDESWRGDTYRIVEFAIGGGYPMNYRLYIGADFLVHRVLHTDENNGQPLVFDSYILNLERETSLTPADFTFQPGPGLKERGSGVTGEQSPLAATGVVGARATEFSLPTPAGGRLSLAEARQGHQALLLNFWFVHCPPCRAEHPHLEKLYQELKGRGLGVLGIDDQDSPADVTKYWTGAGLTFPTVLTGPRFERDPVTGRPKYGTAMLADYASLQPYGVSSAPTNILLDADGRIVYRASGWDEAALRAALARLGIQ